MLSINMDDVMQVVSNIQNYLIAFGVVLVLALLVMFAVRKMPKAKKKMIRAQSGLAILLALAIVVNLICTGPMSTMLDLISGEGSISEETSAEATELVNEITQEGIVLAQNDDNILPVASGSKLNVFGWASTSPCSVGTGSVAPPFGYELCQRRVNEKDLAELDLSCWRVAGIGAEPISAEQLHQFAECFRQVNFDDKTFMPCYGLAENALAVSFSDEGSGVVVNEVDRDILEYQGKAVAPGAETRAVSTFVNCGKASEDFFSLVSNTAGGYSFYLYAKLLRRTC